MLLSYLFFTVSIAVTVCADYTESRSITSTTIASSCTATSSAIPVPTDQANTITAHTDGQCQNGLGLQRDGLRARNKFAITKRFPEYETISPQAFPGTEKEDIGGWNVWWEIPQPPETCRYIVMVPYSTGKPWPGRPIGNEIINVGSRGCYFGAVPANEQFYITMCCGNSCDNASLESASLLALPEFKSMSNPIEEVDVKAPTLEESQALQRATVQSPGSGDPAQVSTRDSALTSRGVADPPQAHSSKRTQDYMSAVRTAIKGLSKKSTNGSPAAKAKALVSRYWYDAPGGEAGMLCKATPPTEVFTRSGPQIKVSQAQRCSIGSCSVSVTYSSDYSTTITSQRDTTFTNGGGFSVSLTTGIDLFAKSELGFTTSYTWSKAVTDSTGTAISKGQSVATANNIAFVPGQLQFVSFTPFYKCYSTTIQCDSGSEEPFDVCQPVFIAHGEDDQKIMDGEYTAVVYDA